MYKETAIKPNSNDKMAANDAANGLLTQPAARKTGMRVS